LVKIRLLVVRAFHYFAIVSVERTSVFAKFGHVRAMNFMEAIVKINAKGVTSSVYNVEYVCKCICNFK
jgi:hypothetical protein